MTASPVIASDVKRASAGFHHGWRLLRFARGDSVRKVARLIIACLGSLLLYALAFGFVVDRPLALGFLQQQIDAKLARGVSIDRPKVVIVAGSNGPYSHRCELIERIIAMPCVNAGVAVGIGLDYLFARWWPLLHAGDLIYLPIEEEQYSRGRLAADLGPDASIMFRHDWRTLAALRPQRWVTALFSFDLPDALMGPIEIALVAAHFHDPRQDMTGGTNEWGDHVGHTAAIAVSNQGVLASATSHHATSDEIRTGDGSALIATFLRQAIAHGVDVIGGLPAEFADAPMPETTQDAIRTLYLSNGADFLELPNQSRYPRTAFFDTGEHLNETWQIENSKLLAQELLLYFRRRCTECAAVTASRAHCSNSSCLSNKSSGTR
jgi:hypothetical protein